MGNVPAKAPARALTSASLSRGLSHLAAVDADLARVLKEHGRPPLWEREQGFGTLVLTILEQQVSLASARAAYGRLLAHASPPTPESFLALDDAALRLAGFSRQKTAYARHLAQLVAAGELDLPALAAMGDDEARAALMKVKGVGPWTAEIYLLMALLRRDAWPAGDLALAVAAREVKGLPARPTPDELEELARPWRPWRAVAARLLWLHYLDRVSRARARGGTP
jgi:DNA-3-methyladenine glycosylase II